jgi:hypothetical protein
MEYLEKVRSQLLSLRQMTVYGCSPKFTVIQETLAAQAFTEF